MRVGRGLGFREQSSQNRSHCVGHEEEFVTHELAANVRVNVHEPDEGSLPPNIPPHGLYVLRMLRTPMPLCVRCTTVYFFWGARAVCGGGVGEFVSFHSRGS